MKAVSRFQGMLIGLNIHSCISVIEDRLSTTFACLIDFERTVKTPFPQVQVATAKLNAYTQAKAECFRFSYFQQAFPSKRK